MLRAQHSQANLLKVNSQIMSKLFPLEKAQHYLLIKKVFLESLSRVSVLSSEKFRGVRLVTSDNSINISANNPEKEQGEESVECSYGGEV